MIYILLFEYPWAGTSQWLLVLCMCMQIINKEHITQLYADGDDQDEDGEGEDGDVVDNWEYDITVVRSGAGENLLLSVSKGEARFPISGTKDGQWKCLRCSSAQGLTCVHAAQFKGWVSELDPDQLPEVLLANINLQEMQDEDADGGNIFTQWNSISSSGRPGPFINYERLMAAYGGLWRLMAAAICGFFIELQLSQSDVVCTSLAGALTHYLYSTLNLLLPAAVLLLGLSTAGGCKPRVLRMQWMQWCTRQRRSTKEKVLPWMCRRDGQHHKREAAERLCSYLVGSGSNIWLRRRVDESAIMF